jgi:hypothetical protein
LTAEPRHFVLLRRIGARYAAVIDLIRGTRFRTEENKGTCACTHGKGAVTDGYKATVDAVTKVLISEGAQAEFLHRVNEDQQPLDRDPYHAA